MNEQDKNLRAITGVGNMRGTIIIEQSGKVHFRKTVRDLESNPLDEKALQIFGLYQAHIVDEHKEAVLCELKAFVANG